MLCLMKRYVDVKKCVIKVIIISFYKKKNHLVCWCCTVAEKGVFSM